MLKNHKHRKFLAVAMVFGLFPATVVAGDIARDIRNGDTRPDSSDGGYAEVGGGVVYFDSPIYGIPEDSQNETFLIPSVNARYQKNGFFAEAFSESENGANLGYNAFNTRHWMSDIILAPKNFGFSEDESEKLRGLDEREMDFTAGIRLTGYYGNFVTQFQFLSDISNTHDGQIGIASIGRGWQIRNWNLHLLFGVRYNSKEVHDYYFGIREHEASERFPVYQAKAGKTYTGEIGITYPITENLVFRSYYRYYRLDDELTNSPLIVDDHATIFSTTLNYVF